MNRRQFLQATTTLTAAAAMGPSLLANAAEAPASGGREYYELRQYRLRRGAMQKRFDDYGRNAAIPACNRAGVGPVGVFTLAASPDEVMMYVLLTHKSLESVVTLSARLQDDADYQNAGSDFIKAAAKDPAYVRIESSLMVAFAGMPKLEVPKLAMEKKPRIFELRTYESHSKQANLKKIEMFNQGEIAIFRRTGITPVFFGEALVGSKLPNLTYLIVYEDKAARSKAWSAFGGDPEWKKLRATPGWSDAEIVSNITSLMLEPADYSQI